MKNLYTGYSKKGLFNYNLREHINAYSNVDTAIDDTIKKDSENFWFYNNGITIACTECFIDGYTCKLYNFSIINGAQTTRNIGISPLVSTQHDFAVACKIVIAPEGGQLADNHDFISKISEASNSQKPILPRDLKANKHEQKLLQVKASENLRPLAIQIKRGVKAKNYDKVEKWQRVTNFEIGQLVLACLLQKPGTARSDNRKIFDNDDIYTSIFKRKNVDYDTLYDLVKLYDYYNQYKIEYIKQEQDMDKIAVAINGRFIILSIIIYLFKYKKGLFNDCFDEKLFSDNITGTIISNNKEDSFEHILFELFKFLVKTLSDIYAVKKESLKMTSVSNFFKTDKIYRQVILYEILNRIVNDEFNNERINQYMKIFDI